MTTYDYQTQLARGEAAERTLDEHFSEWFAIEHAGFDDQRHGIDRWYTDLATGARFSVEYKTDWRAVRTSNAFVEIDSGAYRGWVHTTQADKIFYYVPGEGGELIYILTPAMLRALLPEWMTQYKRGKVPNNGYTTVGLLVPLAVFEAISEQVVSL
jgi:hypothetical protein